MSNADKLDSILSRIRKEFGKGSIMLPSDGAIEGVEAYPTGISSIDRITGIGGIARGRVTEIYGPESSGKSTLALHVLSEVQGKDSIGAYIDAEHAFDPGYAEAIGIDNNSLLFSQPDTGEQALEIVEALVRTGEIGCIVIDSVAALVPKIEIEGEMGQSFIGVQARLMSQALRKLVAVTAKSNTAIIFLNQLREKVGISWGSPEVTPGGRALKFYSSMRIDMRRIGTLENNQGIRCKIKIVKNKMAAPYQETEAIIKFGVGFDRIDSLIREGILSGEIFKAGAWYTFKDQRFHGLESLSEYIEHTPSIWN